MFRWTLASLRRDLSGRLADIVRNLLIDVPDADLLRQET
jgi:hypothetical protein